VMTLPITVSVWFRSVI